MKKNGKDEKKVGTATVIPTATKSWDVDLTKYCNTYGTYYARFTVINSKLSGGSELLAQKEFNLALTYGKIGSKSTSKTEKNQTFRVFVEKVNSALVVRMLHLIFITVQENLYVRKRGCITVQVHIIIQIYR